YAAAERRGTGSLVRAAGGRATMTTRTLTGPDLAQALAAAQAAFLASASPEDTWRLAPGRFDIVGPMVLGAPGRVLALVGSDTELTFGPTVSGSAITLLGSEVRVDGLRLSIAASGDCTGLNVAAENRAILADVIVRLTGASVAVGIPVAPNRIGMQRWAVRSVVATGAVTGIRLMARDAAFLRSIAAADLAGTTVTSLDLAGARIRGSELAINTVHATGRAIGARLQASVNVTL